MKYVCDACGWIYDEEKGDADLGIAPGTKFEDLPEDFECPLCGVGKDMFIAQEQFLKVRTIRSDFFVQKNCDFSHFVTQFLAFFIYC